MIKVFKSAIKYIPEFFIFTPIVLWVIAFLFKSPFFEARFLEIYWWMILGIAISGYDIFKDNRTKFL